MNASRVCLSPELAEFIADRIARYRQEAAQNQLWLAPFVERFGILPLFVGWLETIGILPDGRVRKFSADGNTVEYEGLREPEGNEEVAMALAEGAKRFPELSSALLPRP